MEKPLILFSSSNGKRTTSILFRIALIASLIIPLQSAQAYHPLSPKGKKFIGAYPTYPTIDYGKGAEEKLVKRGEYLARAGDCIACHTNTEEKGGAFSGGLPIQTPYGVIYSPNITPDKSTGIGDWKERAFIRAMHEGVNPQGKYYFPVFPYVYFNKISKNDLRALWMYLRKIPPVKHKNKDNELKRPFNWRFLQAGWRLLYFYPNAHYFEYDTSKSKQWNRGKYLVDGLGHCTMCHTPLNAFGAPKDSYYLTGSFIGGFWAPNITSYALQRVTKYQVADVFIDGELINKSRPIAGPMAEVNHNSLEYLTNDDLVSMATYLKSIRSKQPRNIQPTYRLPDLHRGKQVYLNVCITCHLEGQAGAPRIGDGPNWESRSNQGLVALYRHTINGFNSMPPKGACINCSHEDIEAAVNYLVYNSLGREQIKNLKMPKTKKPTMTDGETIYKESCAVCHDNGKLGAPKLGDKVVWGPIVNKNMDALIASTLNGINNMPPKGGCKYCTNSQVIAAVKYMVQQSTMKGNFNLW